MMLHLNRKVFVSLGSNLGESRIILNQALDRLKDFSEISNLQISRFYRTKPLSTVIQPDFVNAVCSFDSALSPHELLSFLQEVERALGKVAKPKDAPRRIDLDILFFGDLKIQTEILQVPHPRWHERLFVLRPLADLIQDCWVKELLSNCHLDQQVKEME